MPKSRKTVQAIAATVATFALLAVATGSLSAGQADGHRSAVAGGPLGTCGAKPFPIAVFDQPGLAQNAKTRLGAALRREIANPQGLFVPKRGWRILSRSARWAQVLSGRPKTEGNVWMDFWLNDKGRWVSPSYHESCRVQAFKKGADTGEWFVASKRQPAPSATTVKVAVYESSCSSGKSPAGRLYPPVIEFGETTVKITYFVKPPKGMMQTCPGAPPAYKTLNLTEAIGDRELVDGGVYPNPVREAGQPGPFGPIG